jgi:hypothetical protein
MKIKDIETGEELEAFKTDSGDYKIGEETLTPQEMKLKYIRVKEEQEAPVKKETLEVEQTKVLLIGNVATLFNALSKAQGELTLGKKDKSSFGYKYMDMAQVLDLGREPLAKNGLSMVHVPSSFYKMNKFFIKVTTILAHEEGGYMSSDFILQVAENKKQALVQSAGSIVTYLARYSRNNILGIAADVDTDGADTL